MKCKDCKWWEHLDKSEFEIKFNTVEEVGECRRYPPNHYITAEESMFIELEAYPIVEEDDWCGEFKK